MNTKDFPTASSLRAIIAAEQDASLETEKQKVLANIREAIKFKKSETSFYRDDLHPKLLPFLKDSGYRINHKETDSEYGDTGHYITIYW